MPTTFDDFNQMLADIRAKLPKDQPVIEAGNHEGYGFIHMFGGIQAAFVAPRTSATGSCTCPVRRGIRRRT